jgi:hypothetical protein
MDTFHLYACSCGKNGYMLGHGKPGLLFQDEGSFGKVLAEKLNLQSKNNSWVGACNFQIFKLVMEDINNNDTIKNTDTVMVQWTYIDRAYGTKVFPMPYLMNDPLVRSYYENLHDDFQALYQLVCFNNYIKSKLKCKYYFSFVDSFKTFKKIDEILFNELINDSNFIQVHEHMSAGEYIRSLNDDNNLYYYPWDMNHFSPKAHSIIAQNYYNCICNKQ